MFQDELGNFEASCQPVSDSIPNNTRQQPMLLGVEILKAAITCGPMSFKAVPLKGLKSKIRASFTPGKRKLGIISVFRLIYLNH